MTWIPRRRLRTKNPTQSDAWFILPPRSPEPHRVADLRIDDLLFTVCWCWLLHVLGLLRPSRPWRWVITIGFVVSADRAGSLCIPAVKPSERKRTDRSCSSSRNRRSLWRSMMRRVAE